MKHTAKLFLPVSLTLIFCGNIYAQVPRLGSDKAENIVSAMTLDEKVDMVMGIGEGKLENQPEFIRNAMVNGAAGCTWAIPRLGIPPTILADGPAGLRINPGLSGTAKPHYCTAFPTATALASTWNQMLVEKVGKIMGNEVLEYGCDVLLAPAINIQRNPLCGRNFEYYSEDPFVSGKMGAAMIKGVQSNGVGTALKHFVANNQETKRHSVNEIISQRALREIYLRGFEIAVKESDPWMVMSSYNRVNGFHTAENRELLTTILREEWGFKGIVTTDWVSGTDWTSQVYAGNDMLMPGKNQKDEIKKSISERRLDENVLNRNVARILEYIMKTPRFRGYIFSENPDLDAHSSVALEAAEEGIVLLKNENNTLPLKRIKTVALFGKTSYHFITGGTGSGEVNYRHAISLKEGLENEGYKIPENLEKYYMHYIDSLIASKQTEKDKKRVVDFSKEIALDDNMIRAQVKKSDVALITIGRSSGEGWDRQERDYFVISQEERNMLEKVYQIYHSTGKKVIVLLNIGAPVETSSWKQYADAIILSWQTGQEGGLALANILNGKVNPSGKLAVTFPEKYSDVPSSKTFPGEPSDNPVNSYYNDGIYVGYRYYSTFGIKPSYEFGYGLSYTTFKYSDLKINRIDSENKVEVSVTVKNTGNYPGKEVTELYLTAPMDMIEKPVIELKGFAKTGLLKKGESQILRFTLDQRALSSFWSGKSEWAAQAGKYEIKIGASSNDIRLTGSFVLDKDLREKVHYVMQPNSFVKEISITDKNQK
jgi:beta-glucosidase